MTTTSATSSTASIVSILGAGSGIDMAALATNLSVAQYATKTNLLSAKSTKLESQISTASTLKSMISSLATSLGTRVRMGDLSPQPQVTNSSVAKATLTGVAQTGANYSLEVSQLASSQTLASGNFASATDTLGGGTMTIRFGSISGSSFTEDSAHAAANITIPAGATLTDVANAINGSGSGLTAYVAKTADGAKLVMKGADGADNGFVVETSGDASLSQLDWNPASGAGNQLLSTAGDAEFKVDGLAITSKSNTVQDAIPGVSLVLTGTNVGAPTRVNYADNTSTITEAMGDVTDALNEILTALNAATNAQTGDLSRDSGANALRRSLTQLGTTVIMPNAAEGSPRTLGDLGLSIQRDGTFKLDTARLSQTLKSDPQGVAAMFTNGLYGVYATVDSISRKASVSGDPGSLGGSIARYTSQKTKISESQTKLAEQQEALRVQLTSRFAATDTKVNASKSTLSFLQSQIEAWNSQKN